MNKALGFLIAIPVLAQTATWSGGAGNWSDCPPSGNALWDSCGDNPPQFPNGSTWSAVINGVVAVPLMVVIILLAMRKSVVGAYVVPRTLVVFGSIATAVMGFAAVMMFVPA